MEQFFSKFSFFSIVFVSFFLGGSLTSNGQTFLFDGSLDFSIPGFVDEVGFTGTFTLDPSEPDQNPDALFGLFNLGNVLVTFDDGSISDFDQGQIAKSLFSGSSSQSLIFSAGGSESLSLEFSPTFTDANLLAPLDLDSFDGGTAFRDANGGSNFGAVIYLNTQVVPEPNCLAMLILLGGGYVSRRRRSGGPE